MTSIHASHGASCRSHGDQFWTAVFGTARPVCVEIGPGRGEFLLASAIGDPTRNFFAIERSRSRARIIEAKIAQGGPDNARVVAGDAVCLLGLFPDSSVAAYFLQFPDPWWKRRHQRRRVLTEALVSAVARTLAPGGTLDVVTDVAEYFERAQRLLDAHPALARVEPAPFADGLTTTFARKAKARGSRLWSSTHCRRLPGAELAAGDSDGKPASFVDSGIL